MKSRTTPATFLLITLCACAHNPPISDPPITREQCPDEWSVRQAMQGHQERIKDPAYALTASISMSLMYVSGPRYLEEPHHSSTCMPMAKESMAIAQSVVTARHDEIRKRMVEQCKRIVRLPTHHQERSALGEIKRNIKTLTDDMPRSPFEPGEYDECGEWVPREMGR